MSEVRFEDDELATAVEEAAAELTETASLQRRQPELSPLMDSLRLDSPMLLPDTLPDILSQAQALTTGVTVAGSVEDGMYNHHALLELQDTLQETSRPPSAPSASPPTHTAERRHVQHRNDEPFTVAPAAVATAGNRHSATHQKRLDAYYLRLQAYHLQRALATEEKQQLDDRRDRILERHTLTRLKQAMRQQHTQQLLRPKHTYTQPATAPLALHEPLDAALPRQAQVAAVREARLANKHRMQQMYADVVALRKENEEMADERLRRARQAAEEAAEQCQERMRRQRVERQQRARQLALEREASANFATIANSVAQQVGQLERKEWRDNRAADIQQTVQQRKQRTEQHREAVQAVVTENYHRRQVNALLQQQTAQALLVQRQAVTLQRQQQHRLALLSSTHTKRDDGQPVSLQLPPSAVPTSPPLPLRALSVSSQVPDIVSPSPVSSSPSPVLPFTNASMQSSTTASPLLIAQPTADSSQPTTSPLAPLLFLLESKAKQAVGQI